MSSFWSESELKLRELEANEEYDLFAVGYLIPQVALAEDNCQAGDSCIEVLTDYVEKSIKEDKLTESDAKLVMDVLNQLV